MKELSIIGQVFPITSEDIIAFQNEHAITLPSFLVDFFLKYNGAETTQYKFRNKYVVNNFLPMQKNRNASVALIFPTVLDKEEGFGRKDLIPFAIDPGGRPYYVSIGDRDNGHVYLDRMYMGDDNALQKIADTFDEFIDGLE